MFEKCPAFFSIDVESVGLDGDAYAVAASIVDRQGKELESFCYAMDPNRVIGEGSGRIWIAENVPYLAPTHQYAIDFRTAFWDRWLKWKECGAVMVADCPWPCEARFLAMCVDDAPEKRLFSGPYPLIDVASVVFAYGGDPTATFDRLPSEMPKHDPLADARQSVRVMLEAIHSHAAH